MLFFFYSEFPGKCRQCTIFVQSHYSLIIRRYIIGSIGSVVNWLKKTNLFFLLGKTRIQKMWNAVFGVCCWRAAECETKDEKREESATWWVSKMTCPRAPCNFIYLNAINVVHSLKDNSYFLHRFKFFFNILTLVNNVLSTVTFEKFEVSFSSLSEVFLWFLNVRQNSL
jgi:hypothetical protein